MDPLSSPAGWLCTSAIIQLTQSLGSLQSCFLRDPVDLELFKSRATPQSADRLDLA